MLDCILLCGKLGKWLNQEGLVCVGNRTLIDLQLCVLDEFDNIEKIILALQSHKIDVVENYLSRRYNKKPIKLSVEERILDTGGAVKKSLDLVTLDFVLVCNYNNFININLDNLEGYVREKNSNVICFNPRYESPYGNLIIDDEGYIKKFKEKPLIDTPTNCGWYIFKTEELRDILSKLPEKFSLEKDVFEKNLIELRGYNILEKGHLWTPITSSSDIERIEEILDERNSR